MAGSTARIGTDSHLSQTRPLGSQNPGIMEFLYLSSMISVSINEDQEPAWRSHGVIQVYGVLNDFN